MPATSRTKLSKANASKSLRTTVPSHIVNAMKLKDGDEMEWELRPGKNVFEVALMFHKREK